jgi:hypothetical protein
MAAEWTLARRISCWYWDKHWRVVIWWDRHVMGKRHGSDNS